jgi:hypothetical protein
MPVTAMELRVREIINEGRWPRSRKLLELRRLQIETRGVQRSDTERARMIDYGTQDDLRVLEKALQQLGGDSDEKSSTAF